MKHFALVLTFTLSQMVFAYPLELLKGSYTSWGVDSATPGSINLQGIWSDYKKQKDVVVAVVDTGIQHDHPFLKDNLIVKNGEFSQKNFGMDFSTAAHDTQPDDEHNHGTHIAGIIKSVFPEVKMLTVKYYKADASEKDHLKATVAALTYAVEQEVDIINYSAGGPGASADELAILKKAEKKGILVIAAAGNKYSDLDQERNAFYPASYKLSNIITVGAHDEQNRMVSSSNWGAKSVDIAAPGFRIRSALPGNGAGTMTGTSQATAFVTGVAAMVKAKYPDLNYSQLRNIIISSATKVDTLIGKINGGGKLDATKALETADQMHFKLTGRQIATK